MAGSRQVPLRLARVCRSRRHRELGQASLLSEWADEWSNPGRAALVPVARPTVRAGVLARSIRR
jgi:hypothetical protein